MKYVVLTVIVIVGGIFLLVYRPMSPANTPVEVTIGTTTVQVEVASTPAAREQGLSGRASLAPGSGMLFIFPQPQMVGFWMKDMNFSLDMLFADASGKIITIDQNLSPATYLQNPPQVFYPADPAMYVLEVPAGFAEVHGIRQGAQMVIH